MDDKEKLEKDLSLRPDEMDVRGDQYKETPIGEFGAAMLRYFKITII